MSKDMFLRSILPIGILFSASLILSNTAYLYLSVAYIQMLKVRHDWIIIALHLALTLVLSLLGIHSRCNPADLVDVPATRAEQEAGHDRLDDLVRCRPRLAWRAPLQHFWLPHTSSSRCCKHYFLPCFHIHRASTTAVIVRSLATSDNSDPLARAQDGSARLAALLRASLCDH